MENQLNCTYCHKQYSQYNLPRLMPKCGHTYCQNCIKKLLVQNISTNSILKSIVVRCPEDNVQMKFDDEDLNHFPKNISLIKLMNSFKDQKNQNQSFKDNSSLNVSNIGRNLILNNNDDDDYKLLIADINQSTQATVEIQFNQQNNKSSLHESIIKQVDQMCQLHFKPLEIVCIQDLVKICSKCAIFGSHKGHEFKCIKEIQKDKQNKFRKLIDSMQRNHELYQKIILKKTPLQQNRNQIKKKKEKLIKQIKQRCMNLQRIIEMVEKCTLENLDKFMKNIEQKLKQDYKLPQQLYKQQKLWEKNTFKHLETYQKEDNLEQVIMFLNYSKRINQMDILQQGLILEKKLSDYEIYFKQMRQTTLNNVHINFNHKVQQIISECFNIGKKQNIQTQKKLSQNYQKCSTQTQTQSFIHQSCNKQSKQILTKSLSISNFSFIHNSQNSLMQQSQKQILKSQCSLLKNIMDIQSPISQAEKFSDEKKYSRNTTKQIKQSSFNKDASSFYMDKNTAKRKIKIKVPEKYDKVLDGIINDQLQLVDFTNAQLGDAVILQIAELIKGKKVKSLKLIRNKLTDEGVDKIWNYLQKINTLNLSQNNLSDGFLDKLLFNLNKLPNLKSIILSQNKIKQRNVKQKLQQIKKRDIIISL